MTSVLSLNIIPDSDLIHTFADDDTTLPNESYTIKGTVEINLTHPVHIRQLHVKFKGLVECIISTADFFQQEADIINTQSTSDEIPLDRWSTLDSNELGLVDRIARKALGHASCTLTIAQERVVIVDSPQILPVGKTSWPFSLQINNMHQLPPSLLLPHHNIRYTLSARIKLSSLRERVKMTYWNARMNLNGKKRSKSFDAAALPEIIVSHHDAEGSSSNNNETCSVMSTTTFINKKKRQLLGADHPVQVYRYAYPSLYSLHSIPRVRYRGCRQDHINYEIGMSKFTCLQKKSFSFVCIFNALCSDAAMDSIEYFLEQTESYPIRAGEWDSINRQLLPQAMVPRQRKFSRSQIDMSSYRDGQELDLAISLDLPHIAPQITTDLLQITHKLRIIVKFKDSEKERNMSLSFPLTVGTVPHVPSSPMETEDQLSLSQPDNVHVRQELDQWLLTPDHLPTTTCFDKLPSYHDALLEGNPPSPFIEDSY